jgi:hypothetical protein
MRKQPVFLLATTIFVLCNPSFGTEKIVDDFNDLTIIRNSVAYDKDFNSVPPYVARAENVCLAARPVLLIDTANQLTCFSVDTTRGLVLCGGDYVLKTTTSDDFGDGTNPIYNTIISNLCTDPRFNGVISIGSVKALPNGRWLMSTTANGYRGAIYTSDDAGLTWEKKLSIESGYVPKWGWTGICDNKIVVGEYGSRTVENTPRRIYLSEDNGDTWTKIYTHTKRDWQHCHCVCFAPNDTNVVYASFGDTVHEVIKIAKSDGVWSLKATLKPYQATVLVPVGDYIYLGHDGADLSAAIERLNPEDDSIVPVFKFPDQIDDNSHPYAYWFCRVNIFDILVHNGVFYAIAANNTSAQMGGLYVSADGENWVSAYRTQGDFFLGATAYLEGFADGYLWGSASDSLASRLFKMKPTDVATIRGLRLEKGMTNLFVKVSEGVGQYSADDSCFKTGLGRWRFLYSYDDSSGWDDRENLVEGGSCKLVMKYKEGYERIAGISSGKLTQEYGHTFADGDLFCVSLWVKAANTWPNEFSCIIQFANGCNIDYYSSRFIPSTEWTEYEIWGRFRGVPVSDEQLRILVWDSSSNYPLENYGNAVLWIDGVQFVRFPADSNPRHFSSSLFQPGGDGSKVLTRSDEHAIVPMTEFGTAYSVAFDWRPFSSDREFTTDVYLASIVGDNGSYLNLFYDKTDSGFKVVDSNGDAVSTFRSYAWRHPDFIRFCITSNGLDSKLYLETSQSGREIVPLTAVNLTSPPAFLKLDTNYEETDFACGVFCNIGLWDSELCASEVWDIFDTARKTLCTKLLKADLNEDCKVDFQDLATLSQSWLECNLEPPVKADLNEDCKVDFQDLAIFSQSWLECDLDPPEACW